MRGDHHHSQENATGTCLRFLVIVSQLLGVKFRYTPELEFTVNVFVSSVDPSL
jgi:hypothetical protein